MFVLYIHIVLYTMLSGIIFIVESGISQLLRNKSYLIIKKIISIKKFFYCL